MTREDAFLADIIENPACDSTRLIYADWLDGQGREEYGEFIRVQCELANLDPYHRSCTGDKCPGCSALRDRERELFNSAPEGQEVPNYVHWIGGDNPSHLLHDAIKPVYRCGFIAEVRLSCQDWLAHGPALVRRQPIERVVLVDRKPFEYAANALIWGRSDSGVVIDRPQYLPGELYNLLAGYIAPIAYLRGYGASYSTESAAIAALSAAALLWARQTEPAMV